MKKIIYILLLAFFLNEAKGQDPAFSQFYVSSMYLNPSLVAAEDAYVLTSNYRSQWGSVSMPYKTQQVSVMMPIDKVFNHGYDRQHLGGAGISVLNDRAGDGNLKVLGVNLNLGYRIWMDWDKNHLLVAGMQAGFVQKKIDYTNLVWGDQYNPSGIDPTSNELTYKDGVFYPDFAAGFTYFFKPETALKAGGVNGYFGGSMYHINEPDESLVQGVSSQLSRIYKFHGGVTYAVTDKYRISPDMMFLYQKNITHVNFGIYNAYRAFDGRKGILTDTDVIGGLWLRTKDAAIASIGLSNYGYTIAFSYDYTLSALREVNKGRGAFEIGLVLKKPMDNRKKFVLVPKF